MPGTTTSSESEAPIAIPERCENCDVRDLTLCAPLNDTEMGRLAELLHTQDMGAGASIIEEGEPAEYVFNVTGGVIRLFKLLPDGRRSITGFLFPGDFLGLSHRDNHACSAEALSPVMLCRFPRRRLESLFVEMPKLERRLLGIASNELATAQDQMVLLGRKTAAEKIASFLSMLAARQVDRRVPANPVHVPMSRADIADYLGLTTETVSRTFTQLKASGLIELQPQGRIRICDEEALEDLAEGA